MVRFIAVSLVFTGCASEVLVASDTAADWQVALDEELPPPPVTALGLTISANSAITTALVTDAPAGAKVVALVGNVGVGPCPPALGLCLDVDHPEVGGSALSGASGTAQIELPTRRYRGPSAG
jgi:hypothetical protein